MGAHHKRQLKRLLGHSDFGPVLASDTLESTPTSVQAVAGHAVAASWVLPRDADIDGITAQATGVLAQGSMEYAVTVDGAVAASGSLIGGVQADAVFVTDERASAQIASSGALLEIVYAVSTDLGSGQSVRLAVPLSYIGKL